jgi:OmpA-OmpF porin, OOP family
MASKKFILMAVLIVFIQTVGMAQTDWGWDWKDSSKVPTKSLPQYNEFLNNQFPYPPKPRNKWELGLSFGYSNIINSEIRAGAGYGGSFSLRKAITHNWSFRFGATLTQNTGQDYKSLTGPGKGPWAAYTGTYTPNYRASVGMANFEFLYSFNSQSYYRGNPKWDIYLVAGYAMVGTETWVDARAANGSIYNYSGVNYNVATKDIVSSIKTLQDGAYDTPGYNPDGKRGSLFTLGDRLVKHGLTLGAGASYKINPKINIGLEQKITTLEKNADGSGLSQNRNILSYISAHINFNL